MYLAVSRSHPACHVILAGSYLNDPLATLQLMLWNVCDNPLSTEPVYVRSLPGQDGWNMKISTHPKSDAIVLLEVANITAGGWFVYLLNWVQGRIISKFTRQLNQQNLGACFSGDKLLLHVTNTLDPHKIQLFALSVKNESTSCSGEANWIVCTPTPP